MTAAKTTLYMLGDGCDSYGPYAGEAGLDFASLSERYRSQKYAAAESAKEDYCFVSEYDFVVWLIEQDILRPYQTVQVRIEIDTRGELGYAPAHWPLCPACNTGRGDTAVQTRLPGLNRLRLHYVCTRCKHEWGTHDEPIDEKAPMIEDDGRYIENGCVPYSLSQAGGLPIDEVIAACSRHGWSQTDGMLDACGIVAAKELGLRLVLSDPFHRASARERTMTLARTLAILPSDRNHIVATKGHWLPVVQGQNRDPAQTHMRAQAQSVWEVHPLFPSGNHHG